ncbi:MAG TPA: ABC transporter permease subunit [Segeticoccus sp.]|nr:ABC transporter permease subunit [Segeticoccus sp.]
MNPTIARLGLRAVLGRRRGILLFVLPAVLLLVAAVVRALAGADPATANDVLVQLGLRVVLPLAALIASSSVLAPEIDDGSIAYLLAKPIPRLSLTCSKLLVAIGCTVVCAALPILVAALVLATGTSGMALAYGVGALAGGAAYCALFLWLSSLTRHAVVIGLIYVLLWEGLVGNLLAGVRWVSITRWSEAIAGAVSEHVHVAPPHLSVLYAVLATLVVLVGMALLATRRLQGFNLTGDE